MFNIINIVVFIDRNIQRGASSGSETAQPARGGRRGVRRCLGQRFNRVGRDTTTGEGEAGSQAHGRRGVLVSGQQ